MRKTAEEILKPYIEQVGVRLDLVDLLNAARCMQTFASQEVEYAVEKALAMEAEKAKISYRPCGDQMTCGCQGHCDHPVSFINKSSILSLKEQVLKELKEGI